MRGRVIFYLLMLMQIGCAAYFWIEEANWMASCGFLLCILLTSLLYFFTLRPLRAVENGMSLLRAQDYASRLRNVGQKDTDNIVALFNDLMDRLKTERLRLEEQNLFLQQLIDASTQGIVIMDFNDKPMFKNPAAKAMLQEIALPELKEKETKTVRSCTGMIYKVQRLSFMDRGHRHAFYLIESLTEEVRQAERDAYGRVIRTIAHEVNNTIGGIGTVLQIIRDTSDDNDMIETIDSCTERTDKMTRFISAYASLVKLPYPQKQTVGLASSLESLHQFVMSACEQTGIKLIWDCQNDCQVDLDPLLWEQAVVNIIKNSIESIESTGRKDGEIKVETSTEGVVRITDNGAGLTDEVVPQLFTPFFTTKTQGQGIGLMLVSEVFSRHGWQFALTTDKATSLTTFEVSCV